MEIIKKVSKQTIYQVLGKAMGSISTIITLAAVTRTYGLEGTGIFTLALTYLATFFLFADLGLNAYILPKLKSNPEIANKLYSFRFFWSLFLVIIANSLILVMPFNSPALQLSVWIGSLAIVGSGIFNSTNLIYQSKLKYQFSNLASATGNLLTIPIVLYLISISAPIYYLAIAPLFGYLINNLISLIFVNKFYKLQLSLPDKDFIFKTAKTSWPISLTILLNVIYFRVDSFILSTFHGLDVVGNYNLAYSVFQTAITLPTFIMNGFYPILLSYLSVPKNFLQKLTNGTMILLGLATLGTFFILILAPFIMRILGGEDQSVKSLQLLSLSFPAFFISSIFIWTAIALKLFKQTLVVYAIGLSVNILLNLIFIPKYSYLAAAIITGICEYLILLLQFLILSPYLFKRRSFFK